MSQSISGQSVQTVISLPVQYISEMWLCRAQNGINNYEVQVGARPIAARHVLSIYRLFVNKYSHKADAKAGHKSPEAKYMFDKLKFNFRFLVNFNYNPFTPRR